MILFIYLFSSQNPRNIYIFSESKIEKENHHMIDYIKLQKHREEWWALKHRHKLFILLLIYTNIPMLECLLFKDLKCNSMSSKFSQNVFVDITRRLVS